MLVQTVHARPATECGETEMEDDVTYEVELEQEDDGRWIAEVLDLPGCLVYGATRDEALTKVQALALHVVADRLEHEGTPSGTVAVEFKAA
jgi:predicted RNase H-like HicB family nuclease